MLCDIIVPVYNGLSLVKECVSSIRSCTHETDYRLILLDDASDSMTAQWLDAQASAHVDTTILRNKTNLGLVKSCNIGLRFGSAPYIVIANSDVVVTQGWLERLLYCMQTDDRIAFVNPLTNYASNISIPILPGCSFFGMDRHVRCAFSRQCVDVVTGVGFCMLLRRSALDSVGLFDEIFGFGYCEESDLCMRLTRAGFRTVVAMDVYVYHKGQGTFTCRNERYVHNRRLFDQRWASEYAAQFETFRNADPLRPVREYFRMPRRWNPRPVAVSTARAMLDNFRKRDIKKCICSAVKGVFELTSATREVVKPDRMQQFACEDKLRVTYILRDMLVAGGVLSVIQLVNELILLGVDARIATLYVDPAVYEWTKLYMRPMVFKTPKELVRNLPPSDITLATLWSTAPLVRDLIASRRTQTGVYFLQDYEPWFFPETSSAMRRRVVDTFSMLPHHIVKTQWLRDMIAKHDLSPHKIRAGMDLGIFYPRGRPQGPATVMAMARPSTPRRGFEDLVRVLKAVKHVRPDVEFILFGDRFLGSHDLPFEFHDAGVVCNQNTLAELYSRSDVFIDSSTFQGFGRCGIEAMACGVPCVLTSAGGVTEYAVDQENCLLFPPSQPERLAEATIQLLSDISLRDRLVKSGLQTAQNFCHKREARETLQLFHQLVERPIQEKEA